MNEDKIKKLILELKSDVELLETKLDNGCYLDVIYAQALKVKITAETIMLTI